MFKNLSLLVSVYVMMLSCQQGTNSDIHNESKAEGLDSLTYELSEIYSQGYINGFSVAIVNEHSALYQKGFGYSNLQSQKEYSENTIQPVGSISKTLIGIALLKAQEMGKLNLNDPINDYVPFQIKNPFYPEDEISIRHLANHTSTILDNDYFDESSYVLQNEEYKSDTLPREVLYYFNPPGDSIPLFDFIKNFFDEKREGCCEDNFLKEKPGSTFKYSNAGATLAAVIIELATGIPFNNFTTQYILAPLKMTASGWTTNEVDAEELSKLYSRSDTIYADYYHVDYPSGGLISSSNDLVKYLSELIKGYSGYGTLLKTESYRELFALDLKEDIFSELDNENIIPILNMRMDKGIFIGLAPNDEIGHTGADPGVVAFMFFSTQTRLGRILIINMTIQAEDEEALAELWTIWETLEEYQKQIK